MGTLSQLYTDVRTRLLSQVDGGGHPYIKFCQVWNNQMGGRDADQKDMYAFPLPAVFLEINSPDSIEQLGNGAQLQVLTLRVHIFHEFYNNTDTTNGMMEQDLAIFALRDVVYGALQKYEPSGAVAMVRIAEMQDYDHDNVYHFIQEYQTNYIDNSRVEPIGYIEVTGTGVGTIDVTATPTYIHHT